MFLSLKSHQEKYIQSTCYEYISKSNKPVNLSSGMSTFNDVKQSLKILQKHKKKNITLLHCVSSYPTRLQDMNLKRIDNLKEKFNLDIGLSDHSLSDIPAIIAVTKSAKVIEKHVTISRKLKGPDHKASLEIPEFNDFVKKIRDAELLCQSNLKKLAWMS